MKYKHEKMFMNLQISHLIRSVFCQMSNPYLPASTDNYKNNVGYFCLLASYLFASTTLIWPFILTKLIDA